MCGRISLKTTARMLAEIFGADIPAEFTPRYNIAPSQRTLIIRRADPGREAVMAHWGFIAPWSRPGDKGPRPINARSETASESRLFAPAFRARRCIVPADGFYEWQVVAESAAKRPYHITPADGGVFAFAGLWSRNKTPEGEPQDSFTILTRAANDAMAPIHDRMPVILPRDMVDRWLDPAIDDAATVRDMLHACTPPAVLPRRVGTHVNNPRHDDARCIQPAPAGEDFPDQLHFG